MLFRSEQHEKMSQARGFIAALDQSGGSTPKALKLYGIDDNEWADDAGMFDLVHEMRTRIVSSPVFHGDRILGAILFADTMDRDIKGRHTAEYLWEVKGVVPFLKVDTGLAEETDGVQLMKPMAGLDDLLARAKDKGIFGTKMRSVIKSASVSGIKAVVDQQFEIGQQILDAGFMPIIEPEIDINCSDKAMIEDMLKKELLAHLDKMDKQVMLKLTLPENDNHYMDCIEHPKTFRVAALSGGYSREDSNVRLARQNKMVASFSRALTEGLTRQQSDDQFDKLLDQSIQGIADASNT